MLPAACLAVVLLAITASCANYAGGGEEQLQTQATIVDTCERCNGAYYWKTVFKLDDEERQFLQAHSVDRLYVRMFDVVENTLIEDDSTRTERIIPNATIIFKDTIPVSHVVPTVYITVDALRSMGEEKQVWAQKILTRVMNMCSYNGIPGVEEIQVDCDWTETTQQDFFDLCKAMKEELLQGEKTKDIALSSTIRLHQLRQTPPPVDCGVLMVYNTGSFLSPESKNSILSYEDVKPYLDALKSYALKLDYAYPMYSWGLLYHDFHFEGLLRDTDISSLQTKGLDGNRYQVLQDGFIGGKKVCAGDVIRIEDSDYATVIKVKRAIEEIVGENQSIILYHLSSENIKRYKEEEIDEMYK